jgi:hypothetical protein
MKDTRDALKHPRQPIGLDTEHVARFKTNKLIRWMLKQGEEGKKFDLNTIGRVAASGREFSWDDCVQVWQQLGYSVSGFGELSFVPKDEVDACDRIAEELLAKEKA